MRARHKAANRISTWVLLAAALVIVIEIVKVTP